MTSVSHLCVKFFYSLYFEVTQIDIATSQQSEMSQ